MNLDCHNIRSFQEEGRRDGRDEERILFAA